jgi:hypothetical protein
MQIYLYIVLLVAVVAVALIKTYGLGYSRGFDKGKKIQPLSSGVNLGMCLSKEQIVTLFNVPSGNSQEGEIPYLEDTNYQP